MESLMWWMKYTSTATLATASRTAMFTARCGTNAVSAAVGSPTPPTDRSTSRLYRKVATKTPSTAWLRRSAMKLRTSRGP